MGFASKVTCYHLKLNESCFLLPIKTIQSNAANIIWTGFQRRSTSSYPSCFTYTSSRWVSIANKKALSSSGIRHSELCVDEDCKDQPHFLNASLRGLIWKLLISSVARNVLKQDAV